MQDPPAVSLWDASAQEPPAATDTALQDRVDVAIVGAGYTGLSTALHCAEAGIAAQVIEAEKIGHGGSGRNAGLVNAGVWLPPAKVRAQLGDAQGSRFLAEFGAGPEKVFQLIERHQIRCAPTRTGTIHAAHNAAGFRGLERRFQDWQAMGAPVELLDAGQTAARTGSRAFSGGLWDARAGTINPMGYCRGLARAAQAAGARITTGVRVTGLTTDTGGWRVATTVGTIRARTVVLATNAYADALWPGLKQSFFRIAYVQMATEPLDDRAADILPDGEGLWDTAPIMTSVRRDRDGRLILGSMGRLHGTATHGLTRRWATRQLRRMFPQLGPVAFETGWHGHIAMTSDHLPRIHVLAEGLYAATAYNGRGITTGTLFGQAIAALLSGSPPSALPLPLSPVRPARGGRALSLAYDLAFTFNQARRSI